MGQRSALVYREVTKCRVSTTLKPSDQLVGAPEGWQEIQGQLGTTQTQACTKGPESWLFPSDHPQKNMQL